MASLKHLCLVIFCFLATVAVGQLLPPNDDAPRVVVSGILLAHNFTDGTAVLTGGEISASTLNLRGTLTGKNANLVGLTAEDTWVSNIHTDSANLRNLHVDNLSVTGNAVFSKDLMVSGNVTAGASTLNQTTSLDLVVKGDTNIEGLLKTDSNIQVTADVNVGGRAHFMADVFANTTATVTKDLTVQGNVDSTSLFVFGKTTALDVTVSELTKAHNLAVKGTADFGANLNIQGNLRADGDANFKLAVSALDANITGNLQIGMNATIGGEIKATSGQFGNVTVAKDSTVGGALSVGGKFQVNGSATVTGNVNVTRDISAAALVKAVTGHFKTLDVDTATIVSLTSTFVTASTVNTADATVLGKFVVNGPSTFETLTVKSTSTLNDVTANSVVTEELTTDATTVEVLTVTGHSSFDTAHVQTMLVAGRPSETSGWVSSFESGFADSFEAVGSMGQVGEVKTLTGTRANYNKIDGQTGTFTNSTTQRADLVHANVTSGTIDMLWAKEGMIEYLDSLSLNAWVVNATSNSTVGTLVSVNVTTVSLEAQSGWLGTDMSKSVETINVTATNSTLDNLLSTSGTITWLQSTDGTVSTLMATNAWLKNVTGNTLAFTNGTITMLNTMEFDSSLMYNATGGASADWVNAHTARLNNATSQTLYVTDMAWLQNSTFNGETQVNGLSTFTKGFISGEAVLATLTVVGDTSFADLSVTGPSFLTDLWVKRVTISDSFQTVNASIMSANTTMLTTTGAVNLNGIFNVTSQDSLLEANLVVSGTTQFQTGSFSRIGTAIITTTEMETFRMDVANGLFGSITVDDLTVTRGAIFDRSIQLAPMMGSTSGGEYSFFTSIVPSVLVGSGSATPFFVNTASVFHSGIATVDQLVITSPTDPTKAALRITGDGALDLLEGSLFFRNLEVATGITFDNEQNVAYTQPGIATTRTLSLAVPTYWFTYSDLLDRDLVAPGTWIDPATFSQPSNITDLLVLANGQYRVSGSVKFTTSGPSAADSIVAVTAGVDAFTGVQSGGQTAFWKSECVANFGLVAGAPTAGTCYFSGVVTVTSGSSATLRTRANWNFSSATIGVSILVDPSSTLIVEELFERTSEKLI